MPSKELPIIEFISELNLLQGAELSPAQATILKATYGLELNQAEFEIYCRATGRKTYQPREHLEVTVIVGRQGGKTSRIGALCAVYESFRDHGLRPGERAYVYLIAPVTYQAGIAFRFIRDYICASPVLNKKVTKIRKSEIDLDNGITIRCCPCSQISIRGFRVVAAILDEIGFWRNEITAANPAEDVLNALRPAMATFPNHKLIKISTPYRKDGVLWRDYQQREELDFLVWQISTAEMNPTISLDFLYKETQRDPGSFRREYLAQFTDQIEGWIQPEILDQCVTKSYTERPPVGSAIHAAAVDPAFKGNDFALAIAHIQDDGLIILDYIRTWTGTREAPLGYEQVCGEIAEILKRYGLNVVVGDQHCAAIIQQQFQKLGIVYKEFTFGSKTRSDLFGNLKHLLQQRKVHLLDKPELQRQLRALEEHSTPRGDIDVRPAYRSKDDLAVAVAVVAYKLSNMDLRPMPPISLAEPPRFWMDPETCPLMINCANCPKCHDEGECLGYSGPALGI
jgi:hypothetical protein